MLQFKRKQVSAIGAANQREHIKRFLAEHFPQADAPPEAFDGEIDDLVRHCREHGLRSKRAVALYVLAAWLFGGDAFRGDAGLNAILNEREKPPAERSLLREIWIDRKRTRINSSLQCASI